jgi:hypothetical protein
MVAPFGYVHRSANRMSLSDGRGKLGWVRGIPSDQAERSPGSGVRIAGLAHAAAA